MPEFEFSRHTEAAAVPCHGTALVDHDRAESAPGFRWGITARVGDTGLPDAAAIARLRAAGVDAYRFTIDWAAVMPEHDGDIDEASLDRYSALVDELLTSGIDPIVTLGHGRLPARLFAEGWSSSATPISFANFAGAVGARLGDRVDAWETMRDPFVALDRRTGRQRSQELFRPDRDVSRHLIEGHQGAVRVLRAHCPGASISMSIDLDPGNCRFPGSHDVIDVAIGTGWLPMLASTTVAPIDVLGVRLDRSSATGGIDALIGRLDAAAPFHGYRITDGTIGEPLDRSAIAALCDRGLNIVGYLDER